MTYPVVFQFESKEYYVDLSETVTFGTHKKDTVKIPGTAEHMLTLSPLSNGVQVSTRAPLPTATRTVALNEFVSLGNALDACLYASRVTGRSTTAIDLPYNGIITCGRRDDNDIVLRYPVVSGRHFRIVCEGGVVHIEDLNSTNHLYLNGRRITKAKMQSGDVLSIFTFRFTLTNGVLGFENMGNALTISRALREKLRPPTAERVPQGSARGKTPLYLTYHLSPRRREQLPQDDIILSAAPARARGLNSRRGNMAYLIGSGAMMAASMATGMITPASLLARAAYLISPIMTLRESSKMSKEEKQQLEEYEKLRQESYQAYIADQKARIKKIADVQRRIVAAENPAPADCLKTVENMTRNLWERRYDDSDFLVARLGLGRIPLCVQVKTRADADGFRMEEDDELEKMSEQIIEETRYVDDAPVCVSLRKFQTIGLVGDQGGLYYLLRNVLVELTSEHNALDLRLAALFGEDGQSLWGTLRWLPHIWDETGQTRYIAFDEKRRYAVCEMLSELIGSRKRKAAEQSGKQALAEKPHVLIIAQNRDLLYEQSIYEDLMACDPALGVSTLILSDSMYNLPPECQVIVEAQGSGGFCVYEREKYDKRVYFTPDPVVHTAQMKQFFRKQAAIELESRSKVASIPASVTFLQGYGVHAVEELNAPDRWEKNKTYQSMAAPIGVMEGGKAFSLDIKSGDSSHGPHGLLAGTTGSGKSELLQSWILSMAVNYHPHDVNFVIIDYKGGGMSDLMEPLPHVVGKITNIDRNITRSLISLKSELRRRQELFAKYGVNNIDKYQRAYDEGIAAERLPHLVIVTDEFAEMKKEEPEFMAELNSVATIGRSLGIHMLLATQKPAGVVTDQINSNSRFRICMKVQDVADSREMLKRADAAKITQAGRAYVRVGEDEYFSLFQSFYSAAEYNGSDPGANKENLVKVVGVTGERFAVKKQRRKKSSEVVDELTAVTAYLNAVCKRLGIEKLDGPWLPELPHWLTLAEVSDKGAFDGKGWPAARAGLSVPIGKYDIPQLQRQGVQRIDLMRDGHLGIFGIPGSGKTTLLKTILASLGLHYAPSKVKVTVLDAGNWGMSEFRGMPHVQDVILNQEEDKIELFISRMKKEMAYRRKEFLKHAISSLEAYWDTVSEDIPAMVVLIDHIVPLLEQSYELGELLDEIAASGAAFGIYLVFTSNSTIGIKYKFMQLVNSCIAFQMPEKGDYGSLVGLVAGVSLPRFPGRALAKGNPPVYFQAAMYADSENEQERHDLLGRMFEEMRRAVGEQAPAAPAGGSAAPADSGAAPTAGGVRPQGAPSGAEGAAAGRLDGADAGGPTTGAGTPDAMGAAAPAEGVRAHLYIGKDIQDFEPVHVDFSEDNLLIVSAQDGDKRSRVMERLHNKYEATEGYQVCELNAENLKEVRGRLEGILNERQENYKQRRREEGFRKEDWQKGFAQICIIVRDFASVDQAMDAGDKKSFRRMFTRSADLCVMVVVSADQRIFATSEPDILTEALISKGQVLALDGKPYEYSPRQALQDEEARLALDADEAALIRRGTVTTVRREL